MTINNNAVLANDPALPDGSTVTSRAERNERILALWNEGKSGSEIADAVGGTRSAVLALISRARKDGKAVRRVNAAPAVEAMDKQIVTLWNQGLSRKEIQERLNCSMKVVGSAIRRGHESGEAIKRDVRISKNGIVARLEERKKANTALPASEQSVPVAKAPLPVPENAKPSTFLELAFNQCRFPLWDDAAPSPKLYCGAPRAENDRCYCAAHKAIAWKPVRPLKEVAQYEVREKRALQAKAKAFMKFRRAAA